MLKLNRRIGEQVFINNGQITIKIVSVSKGIVCLGINAPPHVVVDRKEIFLRKKMDQAAEINVQPSTKS